MSKKMNFFAKATGDLSPMGKIWFWIVVLLVCVCGFYIGLWTSVTFAKHAIDVPYVTADSYHNAQEEMDEAVNGMLGTDGKLTVLLLGADFREGETQARSDTIMVAFCDLETPSVGLLSVPRDTYLSIEGAGETKVNHAFSLGGEELTEQTLEDFLGVEIDRYLQVDFQGFADVIDTIGGVDINVEYDMYLPWESIDLKAGQQHLNGEQALAYVRWRGTPTADIGRVERQQEFLKTTAEQVMKMGNITKLPKILGVVSDHVDTDFGKMEILSLLTTYMRADNLEIYSDMVHGEGQYINGVSYWIPYEEELDELVKKMQMTPAERAVAYPETAPSADTTGGTAETTAQ